MPRALRYGAAWAAEVAHRLTSVAAMATRVLFMGPPSEGRRRSEKAPFQKLRRRALETRMCEALSKSSVVRDAPQDKTHSAVPRRMVGRERPPRARAVRLLARPCAMRPARL